MRDWKHYNSYRGIRHNSSLPRCGAQGIANDTILIYLSDNGGPLGHGSFNWPLRGGKGSFWEGGMRSHTIFVWPKGLRKKLTGTTNSDLFHVTDWYPTLVRIGGGKFLYSEQLLV